MKVILSVAVLTVVATVTGAIVYDHPQESGYSGSHQTYDRRALQGYPVAPRREYISGYPREPRYQPVQTAYNGYEEKTYKAPVYKPRRIKHKEPSYEEPRVNRGYRSYEGSYEKYPTEKLQPRQHGGSYGKPVPHKGYEKQKRYSETSYNLENSRGYRDSRQRGGYGDSSGYREDPCKYRHDGDYVLEGDFQAFFHDVDPKCNFVKCANYRAFANACGIGTKNDDYGKGFCSYNDYQRYCGDVPKYKYK